MDNKKRRVHIYEVDPYDHDTRRLVEEVVYDRFGKEQEMNLFYPNGTIEQKQQYIYNEDGEVVVKEMWMDNECIQKESKTEINDTIVIMVKNDEGEEIQKVIEIMDDDVCVGRKYFDWGELREEHEYTHDGQGELKRKIVNLPHEERIIEMEFAYDNKGRILSEIHRTNEQVVYSSELSYLLNGDIREALEVESDSYMFEKKTSPGGEIEEAITKDGSGELLTRTIYVKNGNGDLIEMRYYNLSGDPMSGENKIQVHKIEYWRPHAELEV